MTRNVSEKSCRENQNTHFVFNKFFPPWNPAVYGIMWKNTVERGRLQMTIWRVCFACWIPKATKTHSEYVILIAFPPQQWLQERASMLHYKHSTCLVCLKQECWPVWYQNVRTSSSLCFSWVTFETTDTAHVNQIMSRAVPTTLFRTTDFTGLTFLNYRKE